MCLAQGMLKSAAKRAYCQRKTLLRARRKWHNNLQQKKKQHLKKCKILRFLRLNPLTTQTLLNNNQKVWFWTQLLVHTKIDSRNIQLRPLLRKASSVKTGKTEKKYLLFCKKIIRTKRQKIIDGSGYLLQLSCKKRTKLAQINPVCDQNAQ